MNTRVLCISILVLTTLIFWGNQSAARNECELGAEGCETCRCEVTISVKNPDPKKQPSCSVVFKGTRKRLSLVGDFVEDFLAGLRGGSVTAKHTFDSCGFVLYCDKGAGAKLRCQDERTTPLSPIMGPIQTVKSTDVWGNQMCFVTCEYRAPSTVAGIPVSDSEKIVRTTCDRWERPSPPVKEPPIKKPPVKKPPVKKPGLGMFSSMFFGSSTTDPLSISPYVPVTYSEDSEEPNVDPDDEKEPDEIISDSTRWKVLDGEAGIEQGMLMVAKGEVEARSFCTGDSVRLVGPHMLSLPTCQPDFSGRWRGAYARRLADGKLNPVEVSLDLRKESGSVRGEVITSEGTFNIVEAYQSGAVINLQAQRMVDGIPIRISLNGSLTKGAIVFGGREPLPGTTQTRRLKGFVRRLYVAETGLPTAILDQPYNYRLTAFAPEGQPLTFRLATPAITKPEQITWNLYAKDLRGRNGERFTYGCPPRNPAINAAIYGTDVYTDSSSICTAALHSGLIRQAGGVVTIEIKPDAGSYTASTRNGITSKSYGAYQGSYVFVRPESNGGAPGRLPKGLSFDASSGTFSGTPTETGSFDLSVVADDGAGNTFEQPLTLTVKKLAVTNALMPDGIVGQPYSATLEVTGGRGPYSFSGTMPAGLHLDPITGKVSGTPSSTSTGNDRYGNRTFITSFDVTIRDSQDNSESQKVRLTVRGATIMNSHFLPDAQVGVPYRTQFQALGNLSPINWIFGGTDASLIGLTLNGQTGEISGMPTRAGSFFIDVRAEVGSSVPSRQFALTVK